MTSLSPRTQGICCMLFAIPVWSGWVILGRYSAHSTLSPYDITALRFGVAGLILLPVLWRKGVRIGPYGILGGLLLALTMGAPYNTIAIAGMHYAPASQASAIINTTMLTLTTLLSIALLKERTTRLRILGIAMSIAGIVCMLYASHVAPDAESWKGSLLFITAGGMWACYTLSVRKWHVDALHATAAVCVFSLMLYLPVYMLFLPSHIMENGKAAAFQAIYQGFVNSVLALLCFNRGVRLLGASTASAFLPLISILATLLAIPLLHEIPSPIEWLGIALASIGVFLATGIISRRSNKAKEDAAILAAPSSS